MTITDTRQNIKSQRRNAKGQLLPKIVDTPMKPIIDALNDCLKAIRDRHPEVPNAVLVVGPSSMKKYGHFAPKTWDGKQATNEIMLSGEGLHRGAKATLGTLIHECAHALGHIREISDTSRQGRFHNKKFKSLAEEMGIQVEHDSTIGWSITTLPDATTKLYSAELKALEKALKSYRLSGTGKPPRPKTTTKIECGCRSVTVPMSFVDKGPLICESCGSYFDEVAA